MSKKLTLIFVISSITMGLGFGLMRFFPWNLFLNLFGGLGVGYCIACVLDLVGKEK